MQRVIAISLLILCAGATRAQEEGFKPLFNGKDLTGWHNVNCAPGTFFVKDNMIITTGKPTGYLRSDKQYENFIVEFDWFHAPPKVRDKEITKKAGKGQQLDVHEINVGNSGMFVWGDPLPAVGSGYTRSIEVQILVGLRATVAKTGDTAYTSQGDLFSIWGAHCKPDRPHPLGWERCLPSEERTKGEYEWNHYKVVGNDGVLKLHVNGKEVSGVSECKPRKGYLALESEGSECRFKNLKIKELPSTNPKPEEICDVDKGWKCLFNGIDLDGWKAGADAQWKVNDGVLSLDGKLSGVSSEKDYGDFELVCDWRFSGPGTADIGFRFVGAKGRDGQRITIESDQERGTWNRSTIRLKGDRVTTYLNGKLIEDNRQFKGLDAKGRITLLGYAPVQFRNVFIRELKEKE